MLALPGRAHPLGVLGKHQWWSGAGHHHTSNAQHAQWVTGQPLTYPLLPYETNWPALHS